MKIYIEFIKHGSCNSMTIYHVSDFCKAGKFLNIITDHNVDYFIPIKEIRYYTVDYNEGGDINEDTKTDI